jgi:hypothetical protein
MRRAERQLAELLVAGERLLELDTGTVPNGQKVQCVATTMALYVTVPGGRTARIAYADIARAKSRSFWLCIELDSGAELLVDFRGSPSGLAALVVDRSDALALHGG